MMKLVACTALVVVKVDVRITQNMVEAFYKEKRIASRFIQWASSIGPNTQRVVEAIIASRKVEQQSYKVCLALLKLADTYSATRLEAACTKALCYRACPSFRSINTILKSGSDTLAKETTNELFEETRKEQQQHALVRGKEYYGEMNNGE